MRFIYEGNSLKSGVYRIVNILNGRSYIGSAREFKERWKAHKRSLELGHHYNQFLQNDFTKCGTNVFEFRIVELVKGSKEARLIREQYYLDTEYDSQVLCYNIRRQADSPEGVTLTVETRRKMSESAKQSPARMEHMRQLGLMNSGKVVSNETRSKLSALRTGKRKSEETKQKIRLAAIERNRKFQKKFTSLSKWTPVLSQEGQPDLTGESDTNENKDSES